MCTWVTTHTINSIIVINGIVVVVVVVVMEFKEEHVRKTTLGGILSVTVGTYKRVEILLTPETPQSGGSL